MDIFQVRLWIKNRWKVNRWKRKDQNVALLIFQGVGIEMERLAAKMGGSRKFAYNESECLDADYFKVQFFWIRQSSGALIL